MDLNNIIFLPRAEKDLKSFSPEVRIRLLELLGKLPPQLANIKRIRGVSPPLYRLAIEDYRFLFRWAKGKMVIHRIVDRKDLEKALKIFL